MAPSGPGLSQEQLAQQAGGPGRASLPRFRGFEWQGWIEVHDRVIMVEHAAALGRLAGVDVATLTTR